MNSDDFREKICVFFTFETRFYGFTLLKMFVEINNSFQCGRWSVESGVNFVRTIFSFSYFDYLYTIAYSIIKTNGDILISSSPFCPIIK